MRPLDIRGCCIEHRSPKISVNESFHYSSMTRYESPVGYATTYFLTYINLSSTKGNNVSYHRNTSSLVILPSEKRDKFVMDRYWERPLVCSIVVTDHPGYCKIHGFQPRYLFSVLVQNAECSLIRKLPECFERIILKPRFQIEAYSRITLRISQY